MPGRGSAIVKVRRRFGIRGIGWALGGSLALTSGLVLAAWLFDPPGTLSVISADVERLEFRVTNPATTWVPRAGFRRLDSDGDSWDGDCLESELESDVEPKHGQWLIYTRRPGEPLTVIVANSSIDGNETNSNETNGSETPNLVGAEFFVAEEACEGRIRLIVHGPGSLGERLALRSDPFGNPWSYVLLQGSLAVYGRSLSFGGLEDEALYPAFEEPIPLPGGSRLSTIDDGIAGTRSALAGFAIPNGSGTLRVELATEARRMHLYPPGGRPQPTVISIDTFTRILNDPTILNLQALLFIVLAVIPVVRDLRGAMRRREGADPAERTSHLPSVGDEEATSARKADAK